MISTENDPTSNSAEVDMFRPTAPVEYGGSLGGQYVAASSTLPLGCLLLIRVGDFYEAWGDQARTLADLLGITLTGREFEGGRVPMAGVPYHSIERHLATLDEKGASWALLDHITDPKLPNVRRAITRRSPSTSESPGAPAPLDSPAAPSGALAPYSYAFFVQETSTQPKDTWARNGMIFATETEAKQYGCDLMSRWFGICGGEVRLVELHPTYKWVDGRAESLPQPLDFSSFYSGEDVPQQICEAEAEAEDSVGPCRGGCGAPSPEVRP